MIEVVVDSIRISLVSQHRIVVLKEIDTERQLPIWIGPYEADAITIELQDVEMARPVTHDLLKNVIAQMGGKVSHVLIKALNEGVFYASLFIDVNGEMKEIDSRSSDAIALAVRVKVPVFVNQDVMDEVGVLPEPDILQEDAKESTSEEPETLDIFTDFVDSLDFEDFDE
ncbi:MAG: bifunctional nuclease family protein [Ardenticatenaceae bacterium]|nr:bifunctional nuclease family protein [Anaerolineales bacterium]MCB8938601.1 bifunctional nuclease family protein [Ardenticatenaceae bacterium]MCB8973734.1 bifunctional nuclease family protein [Ardenticatenaceae bacterium]